MKKKTKKDDFETWAEEFKARYPDLTGCTVEAVDMLRTFSIVARDLDDRRTVLQSWSSQRNQYHIVDARDFAAINELTDQLVAAINRQGIRCVRVGKDLSNDEEYVSTEPRFHYLKVSPPASQSDRIVDLYINLEHCPAHSLGVYGKIHEFSEKGESLDLEALINDRIGMMQAPRSDVDRQTLTEMINDTVTKQWVELLNYILAATGQEVTERSYVELIEDLPVPEEDIPIE